MNQEEQKRLEDIAAGVKAKLNILINEFCPNNDKDNNMSMSLVDVRKMVLTSFLMGYHDGIEEGKYSMDKLGIK